MVKVHQIRRRPSSVSRRPSLEPRHGSSSDWRENRSSLCTGLPFCCSILINSCRSSCLCFDSIPLKRFPPYVMPLPDRGLRLLLVALVLAGSYLTLIWPAAILNREEWAHPPAAPLSKGIEPSPGRVLTEGCLRLLVYECSRRLDPGGLRCGDRVDPHDDVPYVNTHPSCGSEVRLAAKNRTCR